MLKQAAIEADMKIPDDLDNYYRDNYPHWWVYCYLQLDVPITWGNHWKNAKIIVSIPEDKIKKMTAFDIFDMGFDP
jgi:hypothetical protein